MSLESFSSRYYECPTKEDLKKEYVGKEINELPFPAFVLDRKIFTNNCNRMLDRVDEIGLTFRPHVKTHKTLEGTLIQLGNGRSKAVVVSTLREAFALIPLFQQGMLEDVLYGLPIAKSRLQELYELSKIVPHLRLMIDHPDQLALLKTFSKGVSLRKPWSIFIKLDMGTKRAGVTTDSETLHQIIQSILADRETLHLFGFYCHAGHSYACKNIEKASEYLFCEVDAANKATEFAMSIDSTLSLTMSVGATPTAHSVSPQLKKLFPKLKGKLEVHAGNYPICDVQQMFTNCIKQENISGSVVAEVLSVYPSRNGQPGEVLINAGVIALSREPSPEGGFGIITTSGYESFYVDRLSQEHGILRSKDPNAVLSTVGEILRIIPNHSCITASAFPWYYVINGSDTVVDIWIPWKGW
ncbi:alanine racemase [Schizosaccharomyces cryophilus OY26]|uniref:D-serine dehydratase n=1 Tax=Schizosaccharomyces cryophilus (strain OY26 / ATCC MYA-4695 / CBS 11777 / NBRC 106824 / NRRL Y48691) TaxID=653667 RepID=S9XEW8_SCHCR|nr:alanine racemase [Schizosaccharomyces cryophilus OY26]EPY52311.1 alanine racemase [Schizosaccharomyces cryophilus OY26]